MACPLRCHLVDRSEARSESRSGQPKPIRFYRGPNVQPFPAYPCDCLCTSPGIPVSRSARYYVHVLASELPGLSVSTRLPTRRSGSGHTRQSLQLVCGAVRRFRENCFLLFESMHGLVFRRSVHYWQDQPGNRDFTSFMPRN